MAKKTQKKKPVKKPISKEYLRGLEKADKLVQEAIKSGYDAPEHLALAYIREEIVKSGGGTFVPLHKAFPELDKEIGASH